MDLYPHVAALQLQANSAAFPKLDCFSGYQNVGYWADAYTTQSLEEEESKPGSRRSSGEFAFRGLHYETGTDMAIGTTTGRFVSKIRRFLGRDDMRRRAHSP